MKVESIKEMMMVLETNGVHVSGTTDEFYGEKGDVNGIWVAAEYTPNLFNYYNDDWMDTFGINPSINELVEDSGWFFEWHDAGTMMVWPS